MKTVAQVRCPTCGARADGLLNGLGLVKNGGRQIWVCFFPCNKIVKEFMRGASTKKLARQHSLPLLVVEQIIREKFI